METKNVHTDDECLHRIEELRRQDLEERQLGPTSLGCLLALVLLAIIGLCFVPFF